MSRLFVSSCGSSRLFWLSVLACCVSWPAVAAERRGRPIEFSAPRTEMGSTNFEDASGEKLQESLLRQKLKDAASLPSGLIDSRGSLDGVMAVPYQPPPTPPARNQRVKELLDQRRNWIFMSPEDMNAGSTPEETFGAPEVEATGRKKARLSVVERFYQRLEQESEVRSGRAAAKAKAKGGGDSPANGEEESPMARRVTATENALKRIFDADTAGDFLPKANDKGFVSDWFGQAEPDSLSFGRTAAQKERLEEFKQLLDPHPALDTSLKAITPSVAGAGLSASASWMPPASPTVPAVPSGIGSGNELGLTALPGLNSVAAGQPNYVPPPLPALQRSPQGVVLPPQRKF